jgi:hypothetical protein
MKQALQYFLCLVIFSSQQIYAKTLYQTQKASPASTFNALLQQPTSEHFNDEEDTLIYDSKLFDLSTEELEENNRTNTEVFANDVELQELLDNNAYVSTDNTQAITFQHKPHHISVPAKVLGYAWGKPAEDAIMLGMFSYHLSGEAKRKHYQQTNNLLGAKFKGFIVGTYENSYHKQTGLIGIGVARDVAKIELLPDLYLNLGYWLGGVIGYGNRYPNFSGLSPVGLLTAGISYKIIGLDMGYVPGSPGVLTWNARVNLGSIKKSYQQTKAREAKAKVYKAASVN